jgi:hypothetical protein
MSQPLKKKQILAIFGDAIGAKLLSWLDPCCDGFCNEVSKCEGSSKIARIDITSDQIKNLYTTPVPLIPAPGVGKFIITEEVILKYTRIGAAYTQPGNTNIVMGANPNIQLGTIIAFASTYRQTSPLNVTLTENTGLDFVNTVGNPTDGDGIITLVITYKVIDVF